MAITRVQSKSATTGGTNAGSLNLVLNSTPTNGNILILAVVNTNHIMSVTTTADISWFGIPKINAAITVAQILVGYVRTASASATIAMSMATGTDNIAAVCAVYSGFTNAQLDTSSTAGGSNTTLASGATPTTRSAVELWVTALGIRSNSTATFSSPTNSFAIVDQTATTVGGANADHSVALLEKIVSSTGTANGGATSSQSNTWQAHTITIDDVVGGAAVQTSRIYG